MIFQIKQVLDSCLIIEKGNGNGPTGNKSTPQSHYSLMLKKHCACARM